MQAVGFFKVVRSCTFDIAQAYLLFRRSVQVDKESDDNVTWFMFSAVKGVVADILG